MTAPCSPHAQTLDHSPGGCTGPPQRGHVGSPFMADHGPPRRAVPSTRAPYAAAMPARPVVACVGAVVTDGHGRLLVVRRANDPSAGLWSVPGGKVEPGEDDAAAVVREAYEETGLY